MPVGAKIGISAGSLVDVVGLSGACSGTQSCTFTASTSTSIAATFHVDAKEQWDRALGTTPIVGVAYNSHGDLLLVTNAFYGSDAKLIELDPSGNTLWVHPEVVGQEVRVGPSDEVLVRKGTLAWVYDANGYQLGVESFPNVESSAPSPEFHYPRRMAVLADGQTVVVGTASGTTVEWQSGLTRTAAAPSMQSIRATSQVFVGIGDAAGTSSLAVFGATGSAGTTIANASPSQPVVFDVLPGGDIVTASATASEVSLRRLSSAATIFTRSVPLTYTSVPYTAVVGVSGDRAFWLYSAAAPVSGSVGTSGYIAEILDATGSVQWSIDRPPSGPGARGLEVYDVTSQGSAAALAGCYEDLAGAAGGPTTQGVAFGEGFVEAFQP
jgi:hypothetical protein